MLQQYVPNVSTVSVLCCSKCFRVAFCKCFYLDVTYAFTYTLRVYVSDVSYVFHTYVAFKCFMLHVFHTYVACFHVASVCQGVQGVMVARHGCQGIGRGELGADERGVLGPAVGARQGWSACAKRDERPQIEADRAGCVRGESFGRAGMHNKSCPC
jgi:hypothetical protein